MQRAAGRMPLELGFQIIELLADRSLLVAQHLLHGGRQVFRMAHHRHRRNVPDHRRKDDADAGLAIGGDDDIGLLIAERNEPQHVLHTGDAAAQAFQRADQRARPYLLVAAVRSHRQGVEQPKFQRHLLEEVRGTARHANDSAH